MSPANPSGTNTLALATSPYLRQHADNPVHWQQWTPQALAEAAARAVPILLSVGYAACHWCHVMAHESFDDDEVAAAMNAGFVCIKVDREERPDIDAVYMNATVALTGQGAGR
ncbi:transmembrane protein [Mycobacterium tuberculosis]|nr:transmembrane protein [Mycobacterium tuberculosis]